MADTIPTDSVTLDELLAPVADPSVPVRYREQIVAITAGAFRACEGDRDRMLRALVGVMTLIASSAGRVDVVNYVMEGCIRSLDIARVELLRSVAGRMADAARPAQEPS